MKTRLHVYPHFLKYYILIFLSIFITEIIFRIINNIKFLEWSFIRIFLFANIASIIISLILSFVKAKISNIIVSFLSFIFSFYAFFQVGSFNYIGTYLSVNASSQLDKVTDYIGDFFSKFNSNYYFLFIPFIFTVLFLIAHKPPKEMLFVKEKTYLNFIGGLSSLVGFIILFIVSLNINFMQNKFQVMSNRLLFKSPNNASIAVREFGIIGFGFTDLKAKILKPSIDSEILELNNEIKKEIIESKKRDIDSSAWIELINKEQNKDLNKLNNYFINRPITKENEMTGIFENKNLIMIMLESVNNIPFLFPDEFPTLNKLYSEGLTFTNNYSPRNSCATGNNEMIGMTSLFAINNTCTANVYKKNEYPQAIFNIFKNMGYSTSSYHNFIDQYYDRPMIHAKMGSESYNNAKNLGIKAYNLYSDAPSDLELMEKSIPSFINQDNFMVWMTTVTTHRPYTSMTYSNKHLEMFNDLKFSMSVKRYLSKLKELDLALEYLLEALDKKGILEDSVIVMYGDHYPYGLTDADIKDLFGKEALENQEKDRTPFIIYNSKTKAQKVDEYTTIMNVLPTILNLFDAPYDPRLYMGMDIFDQNYHGLAIFADGSWQSDRAFYNAGSGKVKYIGSDKYTDDYIINVNQNINQMINMSEEAIKHDYFRYLGESLSKYEPIFTEGKDSTNQKGNS